MSGMFGSFEQHGAFIATTAGFPGVYPVEAVVSRSPTNGTAAIEGTLAKASTEPDSGFGIGVCGVSKTRENANDNDLDAASRNGSDNGPENVTAGLPDVGERFVEVAEVEKAYARSALENVEACDANGNGAREMPFNPSDLPDEDYMDLMFMPLSQEDRNRLSTGQSMANLFRELLPDFQESDFVEPGLETRGQNEGGEAEATTNISDEDYMDQVFAPLTQEDKVRLSSSQTKESLFKELLGDAYVGPPECDEEQNDAPSEPATNSPDATVQAGPSSVGNAPQEPEGERKCLEAPTPMDIVPGPNHSQAVVPNERDALNGNAAPVPDLAHSPATVPIERDGLNGNAVPVPVPDHSQAAVPNERDGLNGNATPVSKAAIQGSPEETPKRVKRGKRKKSSRRKVAKAAGEGEQARPKKRRRTRVEDMDPADVHVCDYDNCGKRFARRYNLTIHQRAHRNEYPFRCNVPNCGKPFMWQSSMERHLVVHDKRRKSGGRKQRGKSAKSKKLGDRQYPTAGTPSDLGNNTELGGVQNLQAVVNTVSFPQTLVALVRKRKPGMEVNVKSLLADRWRQFSYRQQELVGMWNSSIEMRRQGISRVCTQILMI
ncbi:KRAB domain containing zinc finger protein [Gracilaria domingensis]|nr:KRAB domain containing zinc finger protein [Gracilaria domingensis]